MFVGLFAKLARGGFRGIISLLLGLALLGALWNASLFRLSSRESAVGMLTQIGVQVINPVLIRSQLGGLSQSALGSIGKKCATAATVPGLKISVPCSQLQGKSLDDATQAVYADVANSYYDNGITGIFDANIPQPIVDLLSGQSLLPQVSSVSVPNGSTVTVPHLPNNPLLQLGAGVGLSISTLTAAGHAGEQTNMMWFGGAALLLLLLLALTSKGGKRLTAMGHALIGSAIPGVVGIGVVFFLTNRYPEQAAPFNTLLGYIGNAFVPVYVGAAAVGLLLYAGAIIWRLVVKPVGAGVKEAVPAMVGAVAPGRGGATGAGGRGGYSSPGQPGQPLPRSPQPQPRYGDARPSYGQPQPPYAPPAGPPYAPRYPEADPWAPQPQQPPAGPGWPQPQQPPAGQGSPQAPNPGQQWPGQQWSGSGDPTQDMPSSQGGSPYARPSPYPGRPVSPNQPANPGAPPYARPSPQSPQQPGWGGDDDWPPRR